MFEADVAKEIKIKEMKKSHQVKLTTTKWIMGFSIASATLSTFTKILNGNEDCWKWKSIAM